MDVKVIPDFLPKPIFDQLSQIIFAPSFSWHLSTTVVSNRIRPKENNKLFLLHHLVYEKNEYETLQSIDHHIMLLLVTDHMYYENLSNYYDVIEEPMPKGQFLGIPNIENLIRIKINFYPNTTELHEHGHHIDYEYSHKGSLLSLNTCDGYTKIREPETKYPSVANTLLTFDPSEDHCSTTTTNAIGRFNININYQ